MINMYSRCLTLQQTFMVINMILAYNTIIGRLFLHQINAVIRHAILSLEIHHLSLFIMSIDEYIEYKYPYKHIYSTKLNIYTSNY